jgi:hypothetical protein
MIEEDSADEKGADVSEEVVGEEVEFEMAGEKVQLPPDRATPAIEEPPVRVVTGEQNIPIDPVDDPHRDRIGLPTITPPGLCSQNPILDQSLHWRKEFPRSVVGGVPGGANYKREVVKVKVPEVTPVATIPVWRF